MNVGKRFEVVFKQGSGLTRPSVVILVDRETGVNYLLVKDGYGAGLTPLLNAEGRAIVTDRT